VARNPYFQYNVASEQSLYEDLVVEALDIYGQTAYYLPRTVVNHDLIFDEATISSFEHAYSTVMYIENVEGFDGENDLFTKFGVELRDMATFVLTRRRWYEAVQNLAYFDEQQSYRPREGDLIYLPLSSSTFEITRVQTETPFYQIAQLPVFKLTAELWEHTGEKFDTNIDDIDRVELLGFHYTVVVDSASVGFEVGEIVTQDLGSYQVSGEVLQWVSDTNTLSIGNVTSNDKKLRTFLTGNIIRGNQSGAAAFVVSEQEVSFGEAPQDFDVTALDFIDWSESNPFGDPVNV